MASIAGRIAAMVHRKCRKGCCAGMAQVAIRISPSQKWNMGSVGIIHCTFRGRAVMTCPTDTRDSAVVITSPQPCGCICVAGTTFGRCGSVRWSFPDSVDPIVTAATWLCLHHMSGRPADKPMTIVTLVSPHVGTCVRRCRPVVLVGALNVATRIITATRRHADVIPTCWKECIRSMAVVARASQHDSGVVVGRPARGYPAVMTVRTLSRLGSAVVVTCADPGGSVEMAGVTRRIGHNVAGGFRRRDDPLAHCMAAITVPRRALENAGDVAGLAHRSGMPTYQREAGRGVIKVASGHLPVGRKGLQREHG